MEPRSPAAAGRTVRTTRRTALLAAGTAATAAAVVAGRGGAPPAPGLPGALGRIRPTSFGTVVVLGVAHRALGHGGHHGEVRASGVHGAWTEAVEVTVQVSNASRSAVPVSGGQFRLSTADGTTVSHYLSDREAEDLPARGHTTVGLVYLAPGGPHSLGLDFDDPGPGAAPLPLARAGAMTPAGARAGARAGTRAGERR